MKTPVGKSIQLTNVERHVAVHAECGSRCQSGATGGGYCFAWAGPVADGTADLLSSVTAVHSLVVFYHSVLATKTDARLRSQNNGDGGAPQKGSTHESANQQEGLPRTFLLAAGTAQAGAPCPWGGAGGQATCVCGQGGGAGGPGWGSPVPGGRPPPSPKGEGGGLWLSS